MSINSSDNVPEPSQRSSFDYQGMVIQGKHFLQKAWGEVVTRLSWTPPEKIDPVAEKHRKIREIGDYLRQVREKQGLSLTAIAEKTHISEQLLASLESGEVVRLPEMVYIRAIIKRVSETLEVDAGELVDYLMEVTEKPKKTFSWHFKLPSLRIRPIHLYFLYLILVILSVRGISNLIRQAAIEAQGEPFPTLPVEPSLVQKPPQ